MTKHNPTEDRPLTEYQAGFLDAMWQYATWRNGVAYIGTKTYKKAREEFLRHGRLHADSTIRRLRA